MQYFYFKQAVYSKTNYSFQEMSDKRVIALDVKLMHSTVHGDKLLYGNVPDPFPQSGHARLISTSILTHMVVQVPGISAGNDQRTIALDMPYSIHHMIPD